MKKFLKTGAIVLITLFLLSLVFVGMSMMVDGKKELVPAGGEKKGVLVNPNSPNMPVFRQGPINK